MTWVYAASEMFYMTRPSPQFTWFHWGICIFGGLVMLVSGIRNAWEWWGDRHWRKAQRSQGLSDEDVRELLEEQQSRRAWEEGRHSYRDRHLRGH